MSAFATEADLTETMLESDKFWATLHRDGWQRWEALEHEGLFGIPDLVVAFGKTDAAGRRRLCAYAFEMKLRNWQRGLIQAYRYSAFAHYSFVVLDAARAAPAIHQIETFRRANIGLVTVDVNAKLTWHFMPSYRSPYCRQTYRSLYSHVTQQLFA